MSADEIGETRQHDFRLCRRSYDSGLRSHLRIQRQRHGVRGLTDGDDGDTRVRSDGQQVLPDAQYTPAVFQIAFECLVDADLAQCMKKKTADLLADLARATLLYKIGHQLGRL